MSKLIAKKEYFFQFFFKILLLQHNETDSKREDNILLKNMIEFAACKRKCFFVWQQFCNISNK